MLIVTMVGLPYAIVKALGTQVIGFIFVDASLVHISRMLGRTKPWWSLVIVMAFELIGRYATM